MEFSHVVVDNLKYLSVVVEDELSYRKCQSMHIGNSPVTHLILCASFLGSRSLVKSGLLAQIFRTKDHS